MGNGFGLVGYGGQWVLFSGLGWLMFLYVRAKIKQRHIFLVTKLT